MEWLKHLLDTVLRAHRIPAQVLWAVAAISAAFLFLPTEWLKAIGLETLAADWRSWFGLAFLVSAVLLGLQLIGWIINQWMWRWTHSKRTAGIIETLTTLDHAEQAVLREFSIQGTRTIKAPINDPVVARLLEKGVLETVGRFGTGGFDVPMTLSETADLHLTAELMGLPEAPDEAAKRFVLSHRPKWTAWPY